MNRLTKQILNAAIITTVFAIAGVITEMRTVGLVDNLSLSVLLPSFLLITTISLIIFHAGLRREQDTQYLFTLSSFGTKFFLVAILSLVYFAILKKTELRFVLLFFILYLAFTFYLVMVILKALKVRSLKKDRV